MIGITSSSSSFFSTIYPTMSQFSWQATKEKILHFLLHHSLIFCIGLFVMQETYVSIQSEPFPKMGKILLSTTIAATVATASYLIQEVILKISTVAIPIFTRIYPLLNWILTIAIVHALIKKVLEDRKIQALNK